MYMGTDGASDGLIPDVGRGILRMLQEAKDRFNAEGRCLPQAYIIKPDATMCHCIGKAEDFDPEDFAEFLEQLAADVHGVGVLSFAESWMLGKWDGVGLVSEACDRFEAMVATIEADGLAWLYIWPIRRGADGVPRVDELYPAVQCAAGLFRLRIF